MWDIFTFFCLFVFLFFCFFFVDAGDVNSGSPMCASDTGDVNPDSPICALDTGV